MSTFVRIICKKVSIEKYCSITPIYVNHLSEVVKSQKGFIYSDSFWGKKSNIIYSMSDWDSLSDWERWFYSNTRKEIYENYRNSISYENYELFYKRKHKNDIFLL